MSTPHSPARNDETAKAPSLARVTSMPAAAAARSLARTASQRRPVRLRRRLATASAGQRRGRRGTTKPNAGPEVVGARWRRCRRRCRTGTAAGRVRPGLAAARSDGLASTSCLDGDGHGEGGDGEAHAPHPRGRVARRARRSPWRAAAARTSAIGNGTSCSARRIDGEPGDAGEGQLGQRDLADVAGEHHDRQREQGERPSTRSGPGGSSAPNVSRPDAGQRRPAPTVHAVDVAGLGRRRQPAAGDGGPVGQGVAPPHQDADDDEHRARPAGARWWAASRGSTWCRAAPT